MEEQEKTEPDLDKRCIHGIPCPLHGHPGVVLEENQTALEIYWYLQPGNHKWLEFAEGEKRIMKAYLDVGLVQQLCQPGAFDCNFLDTLEKLQYIHKVIHGD